MKEKYYLIGIGGVGMSALAYLLKQKKREVLGSDIREGKYTKKLKELGITIHKNHCKEHINSAMTIIYSTDIKKDNPEYIQAIKQNFKVLHRSELLNQLMQKKKPLLVTGTHGKTTTSALLTEVLLKAKLCPSFYVGGTMRANKKNADFGKGEYFVAEADESDGSFNNLFGFGGIITNIEEEHMNFWENKDKLCEGFSKFYENNISSKQHLFWCKDNQLLKTLAIQGKSYGFSSDADLVIEDFEQKSNNTIFSILYEKKRYKNIKCALIGKHNVLNAAAVFGLCLSLKIPEEIIKDALEHFSGVERRMEEIKKINSVSFFDDYAHHPTEIEATLMSAKNSFSHRRIVAIFQPHRLSRFRFHFNEFIKCFGSVDVLIVTDIYASKEKDLIDSFIKEMKKENLKVIYLNKSQLVNKAKNYINPHDVVIALGAGDITEDIRDIAKNYEDNPSRLTVGVIFGGKSKEHNISVKSAKYIITNIDKTLYDVKLFAIDKEGRWLFGDDCMEQLKNEAKRQNIFSKEILEKLLLCDVCIPVFHGPLGEDGMIDAFFNTLNIPTVGCNYASSALCMNKAWVKYIAIANQIPTANFVDIFKYKWEKQKIKIIAEIKKTLSFPVFVKTVHLGSSIGIKLIETVEEITKTIDEVFTLDTQIIVEEKIFGRELEFAVIGNDSLIISQPGEILSDSQFYDYDKKYGENSMPITPKADLPNEKIEEGKLFCEKIYRLCGCSNLARIDCFLDQNGQFFLNEINPFPGMSEKSLFPKMLEESHIYGKDLVNNLIILALHKSRALFSVGLS